MNKKNIISKMTVIACLTILIASPAHAMSARKTLGAFCTGANWAIAVGPFIQDGMNKITIANHHLDELPGVSIESAAFARQEMRKLLPNASTIALRQHPKTFASTKHALVIDGAQLDVRFALQNTVDGWRQDITDPVELPFHDAETESTLGDQFNVIRARIQREAARIKYNHHTLSAAATIAIPFATQFGWMGISKALARRALAKRAMTQEPSIASSLLKIPTGIVKNDLNKALITTYDHTLTMQADNAIENDPKMLGAYYRELVQTIDNSFKKDFEEQMRTAKDASKLYVPRNAERDRLAQRTEKIKARLQALDVQTRQS